jgi:hypothetical protein
MLAYTNLPGRAFGESRRSGITVYRKGSQPRGRFSGQHFTGKMRDETDLEALNNELLWLRPEAAPENERQD